MNRCPRCLQDERSFQAPPGKVVRNPYSITKGLGPTTVYDECPACEGSGEIPAKVVEAVVNYARTPEKAKEYISNLRWSSDHFSFAAHGTYVGVERDGYLHS